MITAGKTNLQARAEARLWPKPSRGALLRAALGLVLALVAGELLMRNIVRAWSYPPSRIREVRNYNEGIATYHFEPDRSGHTATDLRGILPYRTGSLLLLSAIRTSWQNLFEDRDTMGAVAERLGRHSGVPLNVRQYGWYAGERPIHRQQRRNYGSLAAVSGGRGAKLDRLRDPNLWKNHWMEDGDQARPFYWDRGCVPTQTDAAHVSEIGFHGRVC